MTLSRNLHMYDEQVMELIQHKLKNTDYPEILRIAEFIFGNDHEVVLAYRKAIHEEFGTPKISSDPIVFMGKKVE